MIEHEALKFYYEILGSQVTSVPVLLGDHYYSIWSKDNSVMFHVPSIITICHKLAPERFHELNRDNMTVAFPDHCRTWVQKKSIVTYRMVSVDKFKEIVK